ncbi:MAG: hypothetical protein K6T16_00845 [Candidatus Pacearchaeota archaeon]|nr:hypothetical protein [Candidatus Pacearchaeota archaeon]
MDFKIEKQESKPLVEREEILIRVTETDATPSNIQMQEAIAKLTNTPKERIVIKKIAPSFGMREALVSAYVYKSEEALKKFEPKKKEKKIVEAKKEGGEG